VSDIAKAVEVLNALNAALPLAMSLGKGIAGMIQDAGTSTPAAKQAIAQFRAVAKSVRESGQAWLDEHPEE
jgi:hypothetical protein